MRRYNIDWIILKNSSCKIALRFFNVLNKFDINNADKFLNKKILESKFFASY